MFNRFTGSWQSARGRSYETPEHTTTNATQDEIRNKREKLLDAMDTRSRGHRRTKPRLPEHSGESSTKNREASLERTITELQTLLDNEREINVALCEEVRIAKRDKELMKDGLRTTCTSLARANQRLDEYRRAERREESGEEVEERRVERGWALRVSNYRAPYVEDFDDARDWVQEYDSGVEYEWIGKREG